MVFGDSHLSAFGLQILPRISQQKINPIRGTQVSSVAKQKIAAMSQLEYLNDF